MKALTQLSRHSSARPIVTAFAIWFAHFLSIWAAGEIWPYQWTANAFAWVATPIALLAMRVHYIRLNTRHTNGDLSEWSYRFARGAIVISTAAVVFSTVPSLVFLP